MRRVIDKVLSRPSRLRDEERGATAVIVVLTLVALCGMIVLTVDVGQLLFKRRAMVNASDSAALAAAQSCAGVNDSDSPEAMADTFALDNVTAPNTSAANIIDIAGCDGPPFGHVTVEYQSQQNLFFAGVLGVDGPAAVRTQATAGWGPAGEANPLPIVVYVGNDQGNCDIQEGIPPDTPCYLWYDNDLFENSAFGFLNLCTENDPCTHGWDVDAGANCPNVGSSLRNDWIAGNWNGGPNNVNYPDPTYVCVVTGLSTNNWQQLTDRVGDDLIFPVDDCTTNVDQNGNVVGCDQFPNKYNIIGFIVLHLDAVYDSAAEWGGQPLTHCQRNNFNVAPGQTYFLADVNSGGCPSPSTPSGVANFTIDNQASGPNWIYDDTNKAFTWTGPAGQHRIDFDWWLDGQCGQPPGNSSAVCIKVHTVEVRFGGQAICEECPDFGLRAVQLCDLGYGSCPQDSN